MLGELLRAATHLVDRRIVGLDGRREAHEPGGSRLKRASPSQRVRLISDPTASNRLTMQPIALIVMDRRYRGVNGNLMEVRSTQSSQLRIDVGVNPPMQQGIVAEIDARNDMRGAKRALFRFREEIIGIEVQHHA